MLLLGSKRVVVMFVLLALAIGLAGHQTALSQGAFEGFESGDLSMLPWRTGGDASWYVTSSERYEGSYAARAGSIGHYGESWLEVEVYLEGGTISFWYKVSSEWGCDYLQFYIDYELQDEWSGDTGWQLATFSVSPGYHTLGWVYSKDGSVSDGYDTAWIDSIRFGGGPPGQQPGDLLTLLLVGDEPPGLTESERDFFSSLLWFRERLWMSSDRWFRDNCYYGLFSILVPSGSIVEPLWGCFHLALRAYWEGRRARGDLWWKHLESLIVAFAQARGLPPNFLDSLEASSAFRVYGERIEYRLTDPARSLFGVTVDAISAVWQRIYNCFWVVNEDDLASLYYITSRGAIAEMLDDLWSEAKLLISGPPRAVEFLQLAADKYFLCRDLVEAFFFGRGSALGPDWDLLTYEQHLWGIPKALEEARSACK
jgi:hypothetical protein